MSVLLLLLPPCPRAAGASARPPGRWRYVWSANGTNVDRSGSAATELLPKADSIVAVVGAADLSWQRITLPRAPAARLRAALAGALEDQLLEEPETLHFALPPKPEAGTPTWVVALNKAWLKNLLEAIEASGRNVDRVVPEVWPDAAARGHFHSAASAAAVLDDPTGTLGDTAEAHPLLTLATASGACQLRLGGTLAGPLARQMLGSGPVQFTATANAAAAAEAWLDQQGLAQRVSLCSEHQHLLAAASSPWNLRQFDLLPQLRGTRALRDAARRLGSPAWRPARWGLAALVGLQLVGLNAYAWQQQRTLQAKREQALNLLKTTHPQVRAVLDAPLQMQRENERLLAAAGKPGGTDFETLLAAAAVAWPEGMAAAQSLRFENGQLQLSVPGAGEAQAAALRERLRGQGLEARLQDNRVVVQRASNTGGTP